MKMIRLISVIITLQLLVIFQEYLDNYSLHSKQNRTIQKYHLKTNCFAEKLMET